MQIIEFDSYVENGVIAIPLQYQEKIAHSVKVIVMPKNETPSLSEGFEKKKNLYSLDVDMSGFYFDRNEINER